MLSTVMVCVVLVATAVRGGPEDEESGGEGLTVMSYSTGTPPVTLGGDHSNLSVMVLSPKLHLATLKERGAPGSTVNQYDVFLAVTSSLHTC